jgi:hypothetical protein
MKYIVTIHEVDEETGSETSRYSQTVDSIDVLAVIDAVNSSSSIRQRAVRSDAGKPRKVPLLPHEHLVSKVETEE